MIDTVFPYRVVQATCTKIQYQADFEEKDPAKINPRFARVKPNQIKTYAKMRA